MKDSRRNKIQWLLVAVVLAIVAFVAIYLVSSKEEPETEDTASRGTLVETVAAERAMRRFVVRGFGEVEADEEVRLRAQVSGRVTEVAAALEPGRVVAAGDPLVKVDPSDYEVALQRADAALVQARAELSLELGRQEIAEEEWAYFREEAQAGNQIEANRALALRQPQLAAAQARVEDAAAARRQAALNLERTVVRAPFEAVVVSREAAPGQLLSAREPLTTLAKRSPWRVRVKLPVEKLGFLSPAAEAEGAKGSPAAVRLDHGNGMATFTGHVREIVPALASEGRMAEVIVEVPQPLEEAAGSETGGDGALLLGAFVEVVMESPRQREVIVLPRTALHHGDTVYLARDDKLHMAEVEVVWGTPDEVWIGKGLETGAEVVVSGLAAPAEGMRLRLQKNQPPKREGTGAE